MKHIVISIFLALMTCFPVAAQTPVAIELVLALDSSASVDKQEFQLQLEGLALAFRDPDVSKAVSNLAPFGVAIAVIQWGGEGETRVIVPFTVLKSVRDSKAFGFRISRTRRFNRASTTSIATAINDSHALLDNNEFDGQRRVIDVSGDGPDNSGLDIEAARQSAKTAGIVINGLPIEADDAGLADYYATHVIIGANAFIEPARDFEDFARAIRAKLLRELQPLAS
jgi:Protein of unknown function (DUF1194)